MRLPRVSIPVPPVPTLPLIQRLLRAGVVPLLLLGLLLGPGIDFLDRATLTTLSPLIAFAVGWVAAGFGARWEWRMVRRIGWERAARLLAGAAAAFVSVGLGGWAATRLVPGLGAAWTPAMPTVLTLAALAAMSGPEALRRLARITAIPGATARTLGLAALLDVGAGILAFSLVLATSHARHTFAGIVGGVLLWLAQAAGAGVLTALVYLALTRLLAPRVDTALALLAALLVGSGIGWGTDSSPFIVCGLGAALIVNIPGQPERRQVQKALAAWEPALLALVAVAAGALLARPTLGLLGAVAVLAVVRIVAKWGGMRGALASDPRAELPLNAGLALVVQGGVVLTLGVNAILMQDGTAAGGSGGPFLTAVVLGLVLAQVAAVPLLRLALAPPRLTAGRPLPDFSADSPVT